MATDKDTGPVITDRHKENIAHNFSNSKAFWRDIYNANPIFTE